MKTGYWITAAVAAAALLFVVGLFVGRSTSGLLTEKPIPAQPVSVREEEPKSSDAVNINTASAPELEKLPGIGEKTAEAIIRYREAVGGFAFKEQLKEIDGIGEQKYAELEALICIE